MTRLILIGAGGHGKVVADTAQATGFRDIVFITGDSSGRRQNGQWPIVGSAEDFQPSEMPCFLAVGDNSTRAALWRRYNLVDSPVLSHPASVVSPSATLGPGTLTVAGSIINADARVGRGGILNTGCSVDHDCALGNFVHISPGARLAGGVTVGDRSWIGIGAVVREGVALGADVTVGAGAVVVNDIPDGATVVGVPARPLEKDS